ncbi:MAG TPA: ATP-binding protein [Vicinamibacterales bacterium]|nr:ATP-binding protein [Vicinamibacterales bacterium]
MRRWFLGLAVQQKLLAIALGVTTAALLLAMAIFTTVEIVRTRVIAAQDVETLARVVADNTRAALVAGRPGDAQETLDSLRVRPQVVRACLYKPDGTLFAGSHRHDASPCAQSGPGPVPWTGLGVSVPVTRNGVTLGTAFVERDLAILAQRIRVLGLTSVITLVVVTILALVFVHRLHRTISKPITELAAAASRIGWDGKYEMPPVAAAPDEVGELVRAFNAMVDRLRDSDQELRRSNEALRQEVDERRRIEGERELLLRREREANRLKDEFLATVSHELRTPLNAIVGWTDALSRLPPDQETLARGLASLQRNANAQARVIDDLIDVARIARGKLQVRFEPVDINGVVAAAVEVIRPAADQKGVALSVHPSPDACMVSGDQERLQQVVWNLLSNAVKFTPAGGSVTVSVDASADVCTIVVKDTGIGIDPAFVPHLFERFRQADASMTRQTGGLGIGLALVKDLLELHGAAIEAASEGRNRGAAFTIHLRRDRAACAAKSAPPDNLPLPSLSGVEILAVDDHPDALQLLSLVLESAGATVRTATGGAEAIAQWRERPADVLVSDLAMPEVDGFEMIAEIRAIDAVRGRVTPCIAVTAQASQDHATRALRAGFHLHIVKPYDPSGLIREVARALKRA